MTRKKNTTATSEQPFASTMPKETTNKPRAMADGIPVWCSHDDLVDPATLQPNPRNPNQHPQRQLDLLARVIFGTNFQGKDGAGWRDCITVSTRSGYVVKGHGRLAVALLGQKTQVPVQYQQYATEAAEHADMMADNRLAELAEWDYQGVADLIKDLQAEIPDFDLDLLGWSSDELDPLLQAVWEPPAVELEDTPEAPAKEAHTVTFTPSDWEQVQPAIEKHRETHPDDSMEKALVAICATWLEHTE